MEAVEKMSVFGVEVPKSGVALRNISGAPAFELALPGFDPSRIIGMKSIGVGVEGPHYMWSGFTFELPKQNAVPTMIVALKNCI